MQSLNVTHLTNVNPLPVFDEALFESIVNDLVKQGFSVQHRALPSFITDALLSCQGAMADSEYQKAGIGRASSFQRLMLYAQMILAGLPAVRLKEKSGYRGVKLLKPILIKRCLWGCFHLRVTSLVTM